MKYVKCAVISLILWAVPAVNPAAQSPVEKEPSKEKQTLDKLTLENQLYQQKTTQRLRELVDEKQELKARYELMMEKQKLELAVLNAEYKKLTIENKLSIEKRKKAVFTVGKSVEEKEKLGIEYALLVEKQKIKQAKLEAEQNQLAMENKLLMQKHNKALSEIRHENAKLKLENEAQSARMTALEIKNAEELQTISLEKKRLELARFKLVFEEEKIKNKTATLKTDLELRAKKEEWKNQSNKDPEYLLKPFKEGRLTLSDRRIPLNGPIFSGVADYVTERIHYFNNKSSKLPIFIVIDRCPGGSVMEGYRIVKAIEASKAPVHVVVKSFAASMGAIITTLADHSYAYPNAMMLHHQMSTINWGNMTQLKEQLELAKEWERRLFKPLSKKMKLDAETLRKKMYEKNSDGDWQEFADNAQKYNWVNSIVHEIRETGYVKNPDELKKPVSPFLLVEKTDDNGRPYVTLPRLDPFDFYYIYNPDNYYR